MRKMPLILLLPLLVLRPVPGAAQPLPPDRPPRPFGTPEATQPPPAGALELSIEDALRRAQAGSEQVTIAGAGVVRARGERLRALSEWLPQLNASISYDRTLASEYDEIFEATPPPDSGGEDPTGGLGEFFSELPFGQPNIWRAGLSLSYNLYAGGRGVARGRLARATLESSEIQLASARAQAVLDAAQAYYDAVLSQRLLDIAEATLSRAEETLELTRLGREVGTTPEFDLLRARVTFENQRPAVLQRRFERDLALLRLRQRLDLPADRPLRLTSQLEEGELHPVDALARDTADIPPGAAERERAPVRQSELLVRMREASVRLARSQRRPLVVASSQYGRVAYPEDLFPTWDDFRTNWTAGIALQIPLFSGLRVQGDLVAARADLQEARALRKQTGELVRLDTRSAQEQLETARAAWLASAGTVDQARRAYEIAELRYREGLSTQLELTDTRLLLQQAEANRARAARDLQVARIRVALLPALPVSPGTGAGMVLTGTGTVEGQSAGSTPSPANPSQPMPSSPQQTQPGQGGTSPF